MKSIIVDENSNIDFRNSEFNVNFLGANEVRKNSKSVNSNINCSAAPELNINNENSGINNNSANKDDDINYISEMIEKGYIPIFIKVDDYRPLFFMVHKRNKLYKIINVYANTFGIENISNYFFYNGENNVDVNLSLEILGIKPFDVIKNKKDKNDLHV